MYEEGKNIAKRGGGEGVNVHSPSPLNAYSWHMATTVE